MKNKVCGFLVVRKPDMNFDEQARGAFSSEVPKIKDLVYSGMDRMPWFDLDEDYYLEKLPQDQLEYRNKIRSTNLNSSGIKLCLDIDITKKILAYSNQLSDRNEIIALYADELCNDRSAIKVDEKMQFLGVDLYCPGFGSMIREGLFKSPNAFSRFADSFTEFGLLPPELNADQKYLGLYNELSEIERLEPIKEVISTVMRVLVYRVSVQK